MAKYLFIVESPTKAKKIQKFLGSDYDVIASMGHIFDLPKKEFGVDLKDDFKATYVVMDGKKDVIKDIRLRAKKAQIVYLASDPDREGSGISLNILHDLPAGTKAKRIKYHEITDKSIKNALANPIEISEEENLYEAYETRRILDRIVGFKSSYPVKIATGGPSAGRCQSAGLRVLVDREKEIIGFVPVIYWPITAELLTPNNEKIIAFIKIPDELKINTKEEAEKIINTFKKGPVKVSKFENKNTVTNPHPPFTTSSLMQAASSIYGMSSKRVMDACQKLYEASVQTYHRTDSTTISDDFVKEIVKYGKSNYASSYIPATINKYSSKVKNAQEAHECLRPVDITVVSYKNGTDDEKKIYDLVWRRTMACQMSPAKFDRTYVEFSADKYVLSASGAKMTFDGFMKVWTFSSVTEKEIPELKVGDNVKVIDIKTEKKETQPPNRYSEGSFIKTLEKVGIGRPSTYASICQTLTDRKYVELKSKALIPTDLGIRVSDFITKVDFCFGDIQFTSDMEDLLDDISNGKKTKLEVLTEFWARLQSDLKKAQSTKKEIEITEYDCPECKKNKIEAKLVKKHSKYGEFYSCQNYSDKKIKCPYTAKINEDGTPIEKQKVEVKESTHKCPNCKELLIFRTSKAGNEYLACRNWAKDKKCNGFYKTTGEKMDFSKKGKYKGKKK